MWCQNQKFGDPHGCLVDKYKRFGKKISFLAWKKKPWTLPRKIFEMKWEIHFLTLLNKSQTASKKKFRIVIIYAFGCNFGPWEVPQPENAWKWKCMFSGLGTSQGPKTNNYILYIKYSLKKLQRFGLYLTKPKKWISHCIFKYCAEWFWVFFSS